MEDFFTFGVIGCKIPEQYQPSVDLFAGQLECLNDTFGIFPRIEAGDLDDQR